MTILHKKGCHVFSMIKCFWIPKIYIGVPKKKSFVVTFTNESLYYLSNLQWNKIFGIDTTILTPGNHGESFMFAWRCFENSKIQVAAYMNEPNGMFKWSILSDDLRLNIPTKISIYFNSNNVVFELIQLEYKRTKEFKFNKKTLFSRTIRSWFGGKEKAPKNISFILKRS